VAETTDHFADSATIAFCGINTDNIPHGLLPLKEEIAEFVSSAWRTDTKKLIGSRIWVTSYQFGLKFKDVSLMFRG
jgi:hypothetical protein